MSITMTARVAGALFVVGILLPAGAFAFESGPFAFDLAGGGVLLVDSPDARALPSRLEHRAADGALSWSAQVMRLSDPVLSPGHAYVAVRSGREIHGYELATGKRTIGPNGRPFAITGAGRLCVVLPPPARSGDAGRTLLMTGAAADADPGSDLGPDSGTGEARRFPLPAGFRPQQMVLTPDGAGALLMGSDRLLRVDLSSGDLVTLRRAAGGWRLWRMEAGGRLTERRLSDRWREQRVVTLDPRGGVSRISAATRVPVPSSAGLSRTRQGLRWPTEPNSQNPIGNTYGEFQYYGGAPYMHPGVDVMGEADQAIYAVKAGWVKAILTTSGDWHWRVAVGDSAGAESCEGYLYAHLEQNSIAVQVGDYVEEGQYLGGLVDWPVAGFTHIHFARIQDAGVEWYGNWLCTDNPHLDFVEQTETEAPEFEPAVGSDLLAFCRNETSDYLDPGAISGQVDIIAHIGDRILTDWVCTVQEVRLSIYPPGDPDSPVVDDLLAIYYDMALDTYSGGPIDPFLVDLFYKQDGTCFTEGDYGAREFYYILTNTNGDLVYEEEDMLACWDTRVIADGDYQVRVTAFDAAGNAAVDSMLATVANGFAGIVGPDAGPRAAQRIVLGAPQPNPTRGASELVFELPRDQRLEAVVLDLAGRQVRPLSHGPRAAGAHRLTWDGRDELGRKVTPGVYFYRLVGEDDTRRQRVIIF